MVEGRLFTGSHDGSMRVWDASGIRPETKFGKDDKDKDKEKEGDKVDKNANNVVSDGFGSRLNRTVRRQCMIKNRTGQYLLCINVL